ncbi:MAG: hypothetical protein CMM94_02220 [Rickettsiales bacterium]|nr:hypothetical protein [Rickettsiales bacterium]|tara:strand:- start:299 stop:787 length:489 start_codon:yes stop_codon:yes gene_type:complete
MWPKIKFISVFACFLFIAAFVLDGLSTQPNNANASDIELKAFWSPPTIAASRVGIAYGTIHNMGEDIVTLTAVKSDKAESVELHTTMMENDIMQMRKVDTLDIQPNGHATLAPGGLHIMLIGLKDALEAGNSFPLTLEFADRPELTVNVQVKKPEAQIAPAH